MPGVPLSLDELSEIAATYARWEPAPATSILVIEFTGTYRDGSAGTPDAARMAAHVGAALEAWDADGVVLDLSGLRYRWGNGLIGVFEAIDRRALVPRPSAIVRGPDSAAGLGSLCTPASLFDHVDAAVAAVHAELCARRGDEARLEAELVLAIVVSDRLSPSAAIEIAARATVACCEHRTGDWRTRLWQIDHARVAIHRGSDDDLRWAQAELGGIAIRGPDRDGDAGAGPAAIALRPATTWPARLQALPRW